MTTNLNCRLGLASPDIALPLDPARLAAFMTQQFAAGSHGDIALTVSPPALVPQPAPPQTPVSALQLHSWLLWLNQNPPAGPVSNICVLFAGLYQPMPGAFGMMFDRGFATGDDPNDAPVFTAQPRQGCAVFLGAITANRAANQVADEMAFATVHETGHIFNLQHDETSLNFMHTSDPHVAFGPPAYLFTPQEQMQLMTCSTDPNVRPGASIFGSDAAYDLPSTSKTAAAKLKLSLSLPRKSFWRFEPIQVELQLALRKNAPAAVVPQILDPSHNRFRIMIENDRGERALYRPTLHCCGPDQPMRIGAGKPFRRDFPLFGQSGGYTFPRPGHYRVWATLDLPAGRLSSEPIEVEVLSERGMGAAERRYAKIVRTPGVASLLFHREDSPDGIALRKLARYLEKETAVPSAAEMHYALGRAALKRAASGGAQRAWTDRGMHSLERALSKRELSGHQRRRAAALLDNVRKPRRG
jgi:hypothetical protein